MFDIVRKKRFEHDCSNCIFLGSYKKKDIYFCSGSSIGGGTIVARFGDEGAEYSSTPVSMALYSTKGLSENSDIMKKVAEWLIREGLVKLSVCEDTLKEKKDYYSIFEEEGEDK